MTANKVVNVTLKLLMMREVFKVLKKVSGKIMPKTNCMCTKTCKGINSIY